jgi:hypothetical protein
MKVLTLSTKVSVTKVGKISTFGRNLSREKLVGRLFGRFFHKKLLVTLTLDESVDTFDESQCDQIGQNFDIWAKFKPRKIGWATVWAIFSQKLLVTLTSSRLGF